MIQSPQHKKGLEMRCPALSELPPPPPGRMGWPWTEQSPLIPDTMPDGGLWPLISIVTPSYNQGQFIEETIRSVLLQGYPNLEYMIIDGSSTDKSVEVIRKYEPWLDYWVSETDRGQAHAISKGFQRVGGEILAWLNSDDQYCKRALQLVSRFFQEKPALDLLYGDCEMTDARGSIIDRIKGQSGGLAELLARDFIPQPSSFFHRRAWKAVGGLDVNLSFTLDYDLWIRMMVKGIKSLYVPVPLSRFRWHDVSKSNRHVAQFGYEYLGVLERLFREQEGWRLKNAKPQAYHQAFSIIVSGHERRIEGFQKQQDDAMDALTLWAQHLKKYQGEYVHSPHIWSESLYRIGQSYCLHGHTRKGREFFSMALQVNKRAYKALIGWVVACIGVIPYRWYTKMWRALFWSTRRFSQRFLSRDYKEFT